VSSACKEGGEMDESKKGKYIFTHLDIIAKNSPSPGTLFDRNIS
jgi:hypothetical protein